MKDTASAEIREREEINARLAHFWNLPAWTPAMGVLLIAGISPVPGCNEIESSGADLRYPGAAAGQSARLDAIRALERWTEYWEAEAERNPRTGVPSSISPFDFLRWCQEEYENTPDWSKPAWLPYWLVFTEMELEGVAPLPAPTCIVSRAAELEGFAAVINAKVAQAEPSPAPSQSSKQRLIAAMIASIEDGRSPIGGSIVKAIRLANSLKPAAVWHQLRLLADRGEPGIKLKDAETLWIPSGEKDGENLFRKTLGQLLRRHRQKAENRLSESK